MENKYRFIAIWLLFVLPLSGQHISIGSKIHGESRVLAEIMAQTIEQNTDLKVQRRFGLGGTLICFEALRTGEIDLYPEYTGTILTAILQQDTNHPDKNHPGTLNPDATNDDTVKMENSKQSDNNSYLSISRSLEDKYEMALGPTFGFSNTYVLTTRPELGLKNISDLKNRNDLRYGFSNEFLKRKDGFPGLNQFYNLQLETPRGIDHGLAYQALEEKQIDITDAYSTDGRLNTYNFQLLKDDQHFFPPYDAVPIYRKGFTQKYPEALIAINQLANTLNEKTMQSLNYQYEVERIPLATVVFDFLSDKGMVHKKPGMTARHPILRQTLEHIQLTFLATFLAILLAVPFAIYMSDKKKIAGIALSFTGIIQTIPSLALLGFMIPLFGIGFIPAVIALFLYALLPILRNTYTGLQSTDPILIEAGTGMGMTRSQILRQIQIPLAMGIIMAGIRTALIINIGTATLAAFIGAGGLGESIITGITLNDHTMILWGAIPAALLALVADQGMALVERAVRPKGI